MKSVNQLVTGLVAIAVGLLPGCAVDTANFEDEEPIDTTSEELLGGIPLHLMGGGVEIFLSDGSFCSGVQVGAGMVLTSAHCFDGALGSNLQGWVQAEVYVSVLGNGQDSGNRYWSCLSGPQGSNGLCTGKSWIDVKRQDQDHHVDEDFAVMIPQSFVWQHTQNIAWGFYTGGLSKGFEYVLHGAGPNANNGSGWGTMRYISDTLDGIGTGRFFTVAGDQRPCKGDSGGPYAFASNPLWVIGIHDSGVLSGSNQCASKGTKFYGSRMTLSKKNFINDFRASKGHAACTKVSASFPDFWTCP